MNRKSILRVSLGAFALSLWIGMSACGTPSNDGLGVKLQFATGLLAKITHVDLLVYKKQHGDCSKLTPDNYAKNKLAQKPIILKDGNPKVLIGALPTGDGLTFYVLGLETTSGGSKNIIAHGCRPNITLEAGKITPVSISVKAI